MTDAVNSFGAPMDQDENQDPADNVFGSEAPGALSTAVVGSQADKQARVSSGRQAMRDLREQYGQAAGSATEAYAQQRKALQDATQRLLSMQMGPSPKEAAYQIAAAVGTGEPGTGRFNPGGINAANADVLKQQREAELEKQKLLMSYGMQVPQATLGAANARMNQLTAQERIQQTENNNAESKAAAPQKLFDKYYTQDPNDPTKMIDHPEMRAADVAQAAQVAQNSTKAKMALQQFTATGMVTPEMVDLAENDMKSLPSAILRNPVAMSHITVLKPLVGQLANGNNAILNNIKNTWDQKVMGSPAPTNFNGVKDFVTGEISKAVLPNGGGEAERQALAASASSANSPQALNAIIQKWQDLLAGKMHFTKFNWDQSTRGRYGSFESRFLMPDTQKALGMSAPLPQRPGQSAVTALAQRYLPGGDLYMAPK